MKQHLFEYLVSAIDLSLPKLDSRRRLDQLIRLLQTLCSRERVDETGSLKSVVALITAGLHGLRAESLLCEVPPEIPEEEVEQTRRLYVAYTQKQGKSSDRRDLQVLSDLFLLEQMGATKLERVFRAWVGLDTVELYRKVNRACDRAHSLVDDLQTRSGRELALDRLDTMNAYCARLREEVQPVLEYRGEQREKLENNAS